MCASENNLQSDGETEELRQSWDNAVEHAGKSLNPVLEQREGLKGGAV